MKTEAFWLNKHFCLSYGEVIIADDLLVGSQWELAVAHIQGLSIQQDLSDNPNYLCYKHYSMKASLLLEKLLI